MAWHSLGMANKLNGHIEPAIAAFGDAVRLQPTFTQAHVERAALLKSVNRLEVAISGYELAVSLHPDYVDGYNNLGNLHIEKGNPDEAIACYQRALRLDPKFAAAHNNLGNVLREKGRLEEAIGCFQKAIAAQPDLFQAYNNLGNVWKDRSEFDRAVASYRRALQIKPDDPETLCNLASALKDQGELDEALSCYHLAESSWPERAEIHNDLGNVWKDKGEPEQAVVCYRRAMQLNPQFDAAHGNLLMMSIGNPASDRQSLFEESQVWNRLHVQPLSHLIVKHFNQPDPGRVLRIGYVSPDLCNHPVGRFLLPLLKSHDRKQFQVFCYSQAKVADDITARLQACTDTWRNVIGVSDEKLTETIGEDAIDILVDLAMHTAGNRLLVFARKPAPVQVCYLGYAGGTSVETIDYRLTDRYLDPDPSEDRFYFEKSVRLSGTYWCYEQSLDTPPVNELPAITTGKVTLGCLNNFPKTNPPTLKTWAALLHQLPDAKLVLNAPMGNHRERVVRFMEDLGVASDRIEMVRSRSLREYFETYGRIDIALDPFPYCGATTTCDSLWMGVPVVTLSGRTAVGRAGVSILSNVGLVELIAKNSDDYVQIAKDLARNLPRLSQLRATLRQRMQDSPLMNAEQFTRGIEAAYRQMWRTWCSDVSSSS